MTRTRRSAFSCGHTRGRRARLTIETLEDRRLLSAVPSGLEFQVNTYTTGQQLDASVAMDADGDFVVAWTSDGQDGNGHGIYAQRYSAVELPARFLVDRLLGLADNRLLLRSSHFCGSAFEGHDRWFARPGTSVGTLPQRINRCL